MLETHESVEYIKYGQDLQVITKSLKLKLGMDTHRQTSLEQQLAVKQLQVI